MSAYVLALYNTPHDTAAFDTYYFDTHLPIAKKLPGLKSYTTSKGTIGALGGESPYYFVAILEFASMADIETGLSSPEGQATAADTANFATGGLTILTMDGQLL